MPTKSEKPILNMTSTAHWQDRWWLLDVETGGLDREKDSIIALRLAQLEAIQGRFLFLDQGFTRPFLENAYRRCGADPRPILPVGGNAMIYAMSDIHGCFDKYQAMLSEIRFKSTDTLYVLGDVIDRGPDGIKILQDMSARPNVFPILGNHEFTAAVCLPWLSQEITDQSLDVLTNEQLAALSEWITSGGGPTLRSLQQLSTEERQDILEYLQEMELYAEVEAGGRCFVLTHAALENFDPEKPLDAYELQDFLFGRPKPEAVYYPDKFLVFGHTPTRLLGGQDGIFRRGTMIDIDCGCAFQGGRLGCLCLDTLKEFYV